MKPILVVGSVGYDTIATPHGRVENVIGGSANYFSLAASLYAPVRVVGVVGKDYREQDLAILKDKKIDIAGLKIEQGETFRWSGHYLDDLNEAVTLKTELNVFRDFRPELPVEYRESPFVFLANIDPVLQMQVLDQVKNPQIVGLDTMNYWIDSKLSDLKKVLVRIDVCLLNESEALKICNTTNIVIATRELSQMLKPTGPRAVVVKRGEYGFFMYLNDRYFVLPAVPLSDVVDPTGAGDSFAGGFFGYLSRNDKSHDKPFSYRAFQDACVHGSVVASFSIQDFSIRRLVNLDLANVEKRMAEYMKVISFA